jgi:hypothetical protein
MIETELAVVAFIDDLMMIGRSQSGHITLVRIDPTQQRVERRTEIETAPAAVTDFEDPECFFLQLLGIDRCDKAETLHSPPRKRPAASLRRRIPATSKTDRCA